VRLRGRRLLAGAVALVLLSGATALLWAALDVPPVRYLLRYGLTPGCSPTGRTRIVEHVVFVEFEPGIYQPERDGDRGDTLGKICAVLGLPWGEQPEHDAGSRPRWAEIHYAFWIARTGVTLGQWRRFVRYDPDRPLDPNYGDPDWLIGWSREESDLYCAWLSRRSGSRVRIANEAEWECARLSDGVDFGGRESRAPGFRPTFVRGGPGD
jgi:hypothetical protein